MEAKFIDSSPYPFSDVVGQIAVTATKAEWQEVIQVLTFGPRSTGTESLVHWLINQGVYE